MDAVAAKLGIDPIEVRRRNLIAASEMPYTRQVQRARHRGARYRFRRLRRRCSTRRWRHFGWEKLQADLKRRRAAGEAGRRRPRVLPRGERPRADRQRQDLGRYHRRGRADHRRRLDRPGFRDRDGADLPPKRSASITSASASSTARPTCIDHGIGAHAARATALTGGAVHVTATLVREKALEFAVRAAADAGRRSRHRRWHGRAPQRQGGPSISLADIARRIAPGSKILRGREPGISRRMAGTTPATRFSRTAPISPWCGSTAIPARSTVERFMVAYDVGRAVNPMMIEGQFVGGCVAGPRRRAVGGIRLRRDRRAAVGDFRRLSDADVGRSSRRSRSC